MKNTNSKSLCDILLIDSHHGGGKTVEHNLMISNQVIIHEILNALKDSGYEGFTARPWNYFKPETTLWWLVPSTEWPSYKYGKLVLYRTKEGYRIGFHIEKGISELAGQMLTSKSARKLCIKPEWAWHNFISDLSNGVFENRLKGISESAKLPLRISLQASNVTGEYDPYSEKIEGLETDHTMAFEYENGELKILQDEFKGEMRKYSNIGKLTELISVFQEKDMDWFWIDMFITAEVEIINKTHINELALTFVKFYKKIFGFLDR